MPLSPVTLKEAGCGKVPHAVLGTQSVPTMGMNTLESLVGACVPHI